MNYFAHGRRFLDNPHFVAGTAVPDWLNVVNRRVKARSKLANSYIADANPIVAAVAQGIVQHHFDDAWFHQTRAFQELNLQFTVAIRELLKPDPGFRPSIVGHILVELLLDATLIEQDLQQLDAYYAALAKIQPKGVAEAVHRITGKEVERLSDFIPLFAAERFLYDYLDDDSLLMRLNHVMRRIQLTPLPTTVLQFFPQARRDVHQRRNELLAGERSI